MNRYRVRAMFPPGDGIDRLPQLELRRRVEVILTAGLDELTHDGRELDEWEREMLATAISYLLAGMSRAALVAAWWCLTPSDDRTALHTIRLLPALTAFPTEKFRAALEHVRGAPLGPLAN